MRPLESFNLPRKSEPYSIVIPCWDSDLISIHLHSHPRKTVVIEADDLNSEQNLKWTLRNLKQLSEGIKSSLHKVVLRKQHLCRTTYHNLQEILSNFSPNLHTLDLSENGLGQRPDLHLILSKLPCELKHLILKGNELYRTPINLSSDMAGCLPNAIEHIDLSGNSLTSFDTEVLTKFFTALKGKSLTTLDLSENYLEYRGDFNRLLSSLPPSVTSLILGGDVLKEFRNKAKGLAAILNSITLGITKLTLNYTHLPVLSEEELVYAFSFLSPSVNHVIFDADLFANHSLLFESLAKALPSCVQTLEINSHFSNCLDIIKGVGSLTPQLKKLRLTNLGNISLHANLFKIFQNIPPTLEVLDLSNNQLGISTSYSVSLFDERSNARQQTIHSLACALKTLVPSIHDLDLSGNSLYKLGGEGLGQVFSLAPETLSTLRLNANNLYLLADDELIDFVRKLPDSIQVLYLQDNYFSHRRSAEGYEKLQVALSKVFKGTQLYLDALPVKKSPVAKVEQPQTVETCAELTWENLVDVLKQNPPYYVIASYLESLEAILAHHKSSEHGTGKAYSVEKMVSLLRVYYPLTLIENTSYKKDHINALKGSLLDYFDKPDSAACKKFFAKIYCAPGCIGMTTRDEAKTLINKAFSQVYPSLRFLFADRDEWLRSNHVIEDRGHSLRL